MQLEAVKKIKIQVSKAEVEHLEQQIARSAKRVQRSRRNLES